MMGNLRRSLIALVVVSVLCTGCVLTPHAAPPQPTPDWCTIADLEAFHDAVQAPSIRFDDAMTLGASTSRIALSPVVANMQTARQEVSAAHVPPCTETARTKLTAYMDKTIDTFILFMGEGTDFQVSASFAIAGDLLESYGAEVQRIIDEAAAHDA